VCSGVWRHSTQHGPAWSTLSKKGGAQAEDSASEQGDKQYKVYKVYKVFKHFLSRLRSDYDGAVWAWDNNSFQIVWGSPDADQDKDKGLAHLKDYIPDKTAREIFMKQRA